jgi:nitrate reductase NapE
VTKEGPPIVKTNTEAALDENGAARRRHEILMFLFLAVVLWPAIAVGIVGGWGLAVWLYQALTGRPSL